MSSELTLKQARDMALNTMKKAEAERAACADREAREHACPNCAEKDATIARLEGEKQAATNLLMQCRAERDELKKQVAQLRTYIHEQEQWDEQSKGEGEGWPDRSQREGGTP